MSLVGADQRGHVGRRADRDEPEDVERVGLTAGYRDVPVRGRESDLGGRGRGRRKDQLAQGAASCPGADCEGGSEANRLEEAPPVESGPCCCHHTLLIETRVRLVLAHCRGGFSATWIPGETSSAPRSHGVRTRVVRCSGRYCES